MDLLNLSIDEKKQIIIDAYTKLFGEEYKDLIIERISKTIFMYYVDDVEFESYLYELKNAKKKEYEIKFLEEIGIDVSKQISYADIIDDYLAKLIFSYSINLDNNVENYYGIMAWSQEQYKDKDEEILKEYRIDFINFYRGNCKPPIIKNTYEEFLKTQEYADINEEIKRYLRIHEKIRLEYTKEIEKLERYKEYIDKKRKEKQQKYSICREQIYLQILEQLPAKAVELLNKKYTSKEEKIEAILGKNEKPDFEFYSYQMEEILNDASKPDSLKEIIYEKRLNYLASLGIDTESLDGENFSESIKHVF